MNTTTKNTTYNGWKNKSTWSVSLWIDNDEHLRNSAIEFMKTYTGKFPYMEFIRHMELQFKVTPDGHRWLSKRLDYKALNAMMTELA